MDDKRKNHDLKVLKRFIEVYCEKHHQKASGELCPECAELWNYSRSRFEKCPYDPKPRCKKCKTHCYKPSMRQKIKEVMKFSGIYFIKRGRLDWVLKYFW